MEVLAAEPANSVWPLPKQADALPWQSDKSLVQIHYKHGGPPVSAFEVPRFRWLVATSSKSGKVGFQPAACTQLGSIFLQFFRRHIATTDALYQVPAGLRTLYPKDNPYTRSKEPRLTSSETALNAGHGVCRLLSVQFFCWHIVPSLQCSALSLSLGPPLRILTQQLRSGRLLQGPLGSIRSSCPGADTFLP